MRRRLPATPVRDDRGSVAVLVIFVVFISGTLTTFLIDAGSQVQAANRADTYSAEAARAASIAVGPLPAGGSVDANAAAQAARTYLAEAGAAGTVTITGPATVEVSVTVNQSSPLLGISVHQTREHTAQLQVGVSRGEAVS